MNKELEQAAEEKFPTTQTNIYSNNIEQDNRRMIDLRNTFIEGAKWQSAHLIKALKSYMTSKPNETDYADGFRDAIEDCIKLIEQTK
jgi:hypothetical protein